MRPARDLLVLPAAAFALGVVCHNHVAGTTALLTGIAGLLVTFVAALRINSRVGAHASAAGLALLCGALSFNYHRPRSIPRIDFAPGEVMLLSGCIVQPVDADASRAKFVLELAPKANARITVTARQGERLPHLSYGSQVEVEARIRVPRNFGNPGAFDYVGFLRRHEVYWTASARGAEKIRILPGRCGSVVGQVAANIRELVAERVAVLFSPDWKEARLLPALLIGTNGTSDRSSTEDFRRTGTYHALVVSGLHIAVVAGGLLFLMRACGLPLWVILPVAAAAAWLYAAVVNWQPPAVRSAAGFSLFLLARWFFRRGRVLNLLGAVVLAILALDPQAVFDPSFQLTVLSVAAIGGLAVPLNERFIEPYRQALRRLGNPDLDAKQPPAMAELRIEVRLISETAALLTRSRQSWWSACFQAGGTVWLWAVETVLISACIQAALAVPMIFYFHRISVTSVLANLTVSPALSVAVPAAFLACLTGIGPVVQITRLLLWWSGAAVEFWASLESAWRTPDPPLALAVFCLVSLTILGCCLCVRTRPGITWFAAAAALTGVAAVSTLHVAPILHPGELELSIIDVGQGDSLLVVAPDGKTLLVDGGGAPSFDPRFKPALDIGEDVVSPYLWRRGISRLDVIAVTHLHADHAAGLPALIRNFRPAELWTGGLAPGSLTEDVLRAARSSGTRVVQLNESVAVRLGSARVTVLAPAGEYRPGASASNSDSLVLRIAHGSRSFLLTGDADHRVETALMAHPETLEADVLKVAHHGSRSSSQTDFLAAVRPLFAAISAGADNSYGHPHPELVERLNAAGCRSWQTDRSGLVSFYTNGRRIRMENSFQPDEQP